MGDVHRIVVVGGGITGLAAAHAAIRHARDAGREVSVTVLEASPRLGGNLVTERVDGFVLDAGPDSWVAAKPHATALARDLGLGGDIIGTREETRRYYVVCGGRLHPVPEGIVLGVPTRLGPLAASGLFTWHGKLRMALEPLVPARRYEGDEDESIGAFAARRLGREAADRLVAPLLGGISAGDADELSVRAAFPQLVAMERDHGSLTFGMLAARRKRPLSAPGSAPPSAFVSLVDGVGSLVAALRDKLAEGGAALRTKVSVVAVEREGRGYRVASSEGPPVDADGVLLAAPAHAVAPMVRGLGFDLAELSGMSYGSTATAFLAYRRADVAHPLDGVGFVVPRSSGRPIVASTWVSSKWPHRAPEGHVLLRVFFGGPAGEDILRSDDARLTEVARQELGALMGVAGQPLWSRVFRFNRASAQMAVGHLATMQRLRDKLAYAAPGVLVAGGGYGVTGIPDCIREGQEAARTLVERAT